MLPVNVLPDAEVAVLGFLRPLLAARAEPYAQGVTIGTVVTAARPFVQVRRIGGSSEVPGVDQPRLDVIVYHASDFDRMALALLCWALLKAASADRAGGATLNYVSTLMGPRQMPDPANPDARVCMFTVDLIVR